MDKPVSKRLGDVINFKRGYDLPEFLRENGNIPVISSGGISGFHSKHKCEGEGIVIGRYGTLGNVYYVNGNYWPHNTALYVTNFFANHPKYVYYLLKILGNLKTADKSAVPGINRNDLHELFVPIWDFKNQKKIAKVLSDLDAKIDLNNKINMELEAMAKLIYDYWFVQFDFPIDAVMAAKMGNPALEGKPYKSSGGKMVFSTELKREIPEGWEVKELGECINMFDSERVPLSKSEREKIGGTIPYYGATSIMGYVNDFLFDDEYVLLAEDGSVMDEKGTPIVQYIWGKTWVNNHAHVIQAKHKSNNEFIFQLIKMIPVILIKTGSIQMKINQENLKNYKVISPPSKLVDLYSRKSSLVRKQLINSIEQNKQLAELRDWLLPMLMNGQVRVGG